MSSTFYLIAMRRRSRSGWMIILVSNSSAVIARRRTLKRPPNRRESLQVADRWHLLKNLRKAIERLFKRRSNEVTEAVKTPATATESVCSPASTDAEDGITSVESSTPPQPTTKEPRK